MKNLYLGHPPFFRPFTLLFTLLCVLFSVSISYGATLPEGFVETRIAKDLDPTGVSIAPDGRVFITQKNGTISIVKNGAMLPAPFLSLTVDNFNERGLMSMAFDPDFENNGYVYVFYTASEPGTEFAFNRVSRFTANGDVADPNSELVLYTFHRVSAGIHNGGYVFFKDGKLFATHGDNAYGPNSQNLLSNLGKVIRINPDGTIPTDNPFYNQTTGELRAIYALGLRNPFKGSVDPQTGRVFINDVGQAAYEEVNELVAGGNYGWPAIEGPIAGQTPPANYQDPVYYYGRTNGCSITAAAFYNPASSPYPAEWQGKFFFGDYCHNYLKALDPQTGAVSTFGTGFNRPLDVAVDNSGIMYVLVRQGLGGGSQQDNTSSSDGELWRITYTGSSAPVITVQPEDVSTTQGDDVLFTVAASGSDLNYQWIRNGANIPGATSSSYLEEDVDAADDGSTYRVLVFNTAGSVISRAATLNVSGNTPPIANITGLDAANLYQGGQTINFSGTASDAEDGTLPASAYTWWVDFHHDTHTHPALDETSGITSGSFTISRTNETSDNVWYRIYLRVTDSDGSSTVTSREIYPQKSQVTLTTNPPGLKLTLDGQEVNSPYQFTGVVGITRTIGAPGPQTSGGNTYTFSQWSNGGSSTQDINTPATNTTYTAIYQQQTTPPGGLRAPDNPANAVNGLDYNYYEQFWYAQPNLEQYTPDASGTASLPDLSQRNQDDQFGFRYTGFVEVPADGEYTFYTSSDDGSMLYIGNELVVDNGGLHALQERSGTIGLQAGRHAVRIEYFEKSGGQSLLVSYSGPGLVKTEIPANAYYRQGDDTGPPDPTPDVNLLLEAENAVVVGANILQWIPDYTGTGYVDYSAQHNDYIEWSANIPAAADYVLTFRYVLGATANRPLELRINGNVVNPSLDFPVTNGWDDWQEVTATVSLQAGVNTIRTTAIGYSGGNIDHLRITNVPAASSSRMAVGSTGLRELQVYPVPARDRLNVAFDAPIRAITLTDATGRIVLSRSAVNEISIELDMVSLPAGLYLLQVNTVEGTFRKRVVVKR